RVYVGTGEGNDTLMALSGEGLLVTEDGGQTWATVPLPVPAYGSSRVSAIVVAPDGKRVFIASLGGLFQRTLQADSTWKLELLQQGWASDLAFDAASDRLFIGKTGEGVFVRIGTGAISQLGRSGAADKQLPDPATLTDANLEIERVSLGWIES